MRLTQSSSKLRVLTVGQDIDGVVVARVLEIEELTEFKKPIRYCRSTTGSSDADERFVICGATNFWSGIWSRWRCRVLRCRAARDRGP